MQQLRWRVKRGINWNKYQSNQYSDFLIYLIFQGVDRFFVLLFAHGTQRTNHKKILSATKLANYIVMIDERNIFDQ